MKIAITGGIGSGKSYVCRLLRKRGIKVYDCDSAAKRLMQTSEVLQEQLKALVGDSLYKNGRLVKSVMTTFILSNPDNMRAVNGIVHPAVAEDFVHSGLNWMECAILFESGFNRLVDRIICVTAPLELRIQRIMSRDNLQREQALQWISKQMPQKEMVERSHFVLLNDDSQCTEQHLDDILCQIHKES